MLTVTSKVQLNTMRKEKSALEFETMMISNQIKMLTDCMDNMQRQTGLKDSELKDYPAYQQFAAAEEALEERNDLIATELEELKNDIESFESYHQNGIKSDTSFWCFGGG